MSLVRSICEKENPDLIVGMSMGGFITQKLRGRKKVLVNPDFHIAGLMKTMIGEVKYLSPRKDGSLSFFITPEICEGWEKLEEGQFDGLSQSEIEKTIGFFADADEMVRCGDEFSSHYPSRGISYPARSMNSKASQQQ